MTSTRRPPSCRPVRPAASSPSATSSSSSTPATTSTCDTDTATCSGTIDAARISDTQLAPDFFATSAAIRLRRDAAARIAPAVGSTETIAGQQATCVAVPVTAATETYCALDGGPLARLDAADLRIELTSWSATVDESQFSAS